MSTANATRRAPVALAASAHVLRVGRPSRVWRGPFQPRRNDSRQSVTCRQADSRRVALRPHVSRHVNDVLWMPAAGPNRSAAYTYGIRLPAFGEAVLQMQMARIMLDPT